MPEVEERRREREGPADYVHRLARSKAAHVASRNSLVLAADTVVVIDGDVLEKPCSDAEARRMLARLAGREHRVLTGVTLRDAATSATLTEVATSIVEIRCLDQDEIDWYVRTGEPSDKAGGYALQGIGGLFVTAVHGSYSNVIGLPLHLVYELFDRLGHDLKDRCEAAGRAQALDTLAIR